MNICMLAPEFPPVWGGVGTYVFELVRHLPKDVDVHVVTPIREGFGKQEVSALAYDPLDYLGSNVHLHFVCRATDSFFYNARFQYACLKQIPMIVKEEGIDVIHSHAAQMPDLLLMLRKLDKPFVTTIHTTIKSQRMGTKASNLNFHEMEKSEKATYSLYPVLRFAEELYFRQRRLYVTPSHWMKRWFEDNFRIAVSLKVIPNCIDVDEYGADKRGFLLETIIPRDLRDKKIVLYVGRMLAMKGVDVLVKAIPEILKRMGSDELLFVFSGPGDCSRFRKRLEEMNVKSHCLFTGPLPKETIIQLVMRSELVAVPSYYENCPYVVLESMACGTPVVASNVGGIPEIITNNYDGILVESGSPSALANAIVRLLTNRSLRGLISQRGRATIIKRFSWKANLAEYLNIYFEALKSARDR